MLYALLAKPMQTIGRGPSLIEDIYADGADDFAIETPGRYGHLNGGHIDLLWFAFQLILGELHGRFFDAIAGPIEFPFHGPFYGS